MNKYLKVGALSALLLNTLAFSNANHHQSKYVGQENRSIKSLSDDDIKVLKKGGGWGFAKAAELNGYPGPSHLLQMKDKINLSKVQTEEIQATFNKMKEEAIILGNKLISLEEKLNNEFQNKTINQSKLNQYIDKIMSTRSQLRLVHLSTHLQTPTVLTPKQIKLYNHLRGYSKISQAKTSKEQDVKHHQ